MLRDNPREAALTWMLRGRERRVRAPLMPLRKRDTRGGTVRFWRSRSRGLSQLAWLRLPVLSFQLGAEVFEEEDRFVGDVDQLAADDRARRDDVDAFAARAEQID